MRIDVRGLQLRNKTYQFRRAVPPDLVEIVGRREWKRSLGLGPGQELQAHAEAERLWRETEQQIDALRREMKLGNNKAVLAKKAAEWADHFQYLDGQPKAERETAFINGEWVELDSERDLAIEHIIEAAGREFGWDHKGHPKRLTPEQEARLAVLIEGRPVAPAITVSAAKDLYIADRFGGREDKATRQAVKQFIEMVGDLELAQINRRTVIKWLQDLVNKRDQAEGTVRRRLTSLKAIYNHIRKNYDLTADNPFANQEMPTARKGKRPPVPFHKRHFDLIDRHLTTPSVNPDIRRILTLLRYTGCRPMEIGGLSKSEVYLNLEIPAIRVRWTANRRLKTRSAERLLPLVGPALDAAQEALKAAQGEHLFGERFLNTNRLSQALVKELHKAGIPKSPNRLIPYSFRHSMKEALRMAEVLEETQDALMGHARKGMGAHYGVPDRPAHVLKTALERAIPHLGEVDETHYLPGELP